MLILRMTCKTLRMDRTVKLDPRVRVRSDSTTATTEATASRSRELRPSPRQAPAARQHQHTGHANGFDGFEASDEDDDDEAPEDGPLESAKLAAEATPETGAGDARPVRILCFGAAVFGVADVSHGHVWVSGCGSSEGEA